MPREDSQRNIKVKNVARKRSRNADANRETVKEMIIRSLQELPESASLDLIENRFWFLMKIARGLEDADAGRTIPHEEVARYLEDRYGFVPNPEELQNVSE